MSRPEPAELTARLARKAQEDATAVREFAANPQIADSIIGFHAQQAAEKWLKAVMAARGIKQTRIHDIGRLIQLLEANGAELPPIKEQLDELTVYAVPLRYDELLDTEPLDTEAVVRLVESIGDWANNQLA